MNVFELEDTASDLLEDIALIIGSDSDVWIGDT